jgi:hypothetical protein
VLTLARPHEVELAGRAFDRGLDRRTELVRLGRIRTDGPLLDHQCLGEPDQIARRELAVHHAPRARFLDRLGKTGNKCLVELHLW